MGSKTAIKERKAETPQVDGCRHHWLIESPRGAISMGRCKRCGTEREFRNSANDYIWDDDSSSSGYGSGGIGVRRSPKAGIEDDDGVAASGSNREPALVV